LRFAPESRDDEDFAIDLAQSRQYGAEPRLASGVIVAPDDDAAAGERGHIGAVERARAHGRCGGDHGVAEDHTRGVGRFFALDEDDILVRVGEDLRKVE
jgi:hypothetical protein